MLTKAVEFGKCRGMVPATRTNGNYTGKVIFKYVQIRLVASNEPLMGCGPLPDWLRKKHKQSIFDPRLENGLSFSKKLPQNLGN